MNGQPITEVLLVFGIANIWMNRVIAGNTRGYGNVQSQAVVYADFSCLQSKGNEKVDAGPDFYGRLHHSYLLHFSGLLQATSG